MEVGKAVFMQGLLVVLCLQIYIIMSANSIIMVANENHFTRAYFDYWIHEKMIFLIFIFWWYSFSYARIFTPLYF